MNLLPALLSLVLGPPAGTPLPSARFATSWLDQTVAVEFRIAADQFDEWMNRFEAAKRDHNFPACEAALKQALSIRVTDYAAGSLVWAQFNQNKTEEALSSAKWMLDAVGRTPYALASYLDASIREGARENFRSAIDYARQAHLDSGEDWTNAYLRDMISKADDLVTPAVYELQWTIPGSEFTDSNPTRLFEFPLLDTKDQKFTFTLSGERDYKIRMSNAGRALVDVTGSPGQPVTVSGLVTLQPEFVGGRAFRQLAAKPLVAAPPTQIGVFYYWTEPFDPKTNSIQTVVKQVSRKSAVETIQAILDWRDANMPYAELPPGEGSTLDRIMKYRRGVCHQSSYLCASLARANGIPAFVMGGFKLPESGAFKNQEGSHGWICVKLPDRGWTEVESLDRNSFCDFTGKSYVRFKRQESRDDLAAISLQGFPVSGRRIR